MHVRVRIYTYVYTHMHIRETLKDVRKLIYTVRTFVQKFYLAIEYVCT